jgi:hypothetical protein
MTEMKVPPPLADVKLGSPRGQQLLNFNKSAAKSLLSRIGREVCGPNDEIPAKIRN